MGRPYAIDDERRRQFGGVFLLDAMMSDEVGYPLLLEGDDSQLEPILEWLHGKDYIGIGAERYEPTDKGREVYKRFMARYIDYLKVFDIYSTVDLQEGEFAFSKILDFDDDADWRDYVSSDRWDDLRIAVAEFKGIDPVEIVFMSFLNEGRIDRETTGWQFDLLSGGMWDELVEICNTSLSEEDLAYEKDGQDVSGRSVLEEVIREGAQLNMDLKRREAEMEEEDPDEGSGGAGGTEEVTEEVVVEEYTDVHYTPYLDPFYVSPVWMALWLI